MVVEAALKLALKCVPPSLVRATLGDFVPVFMLHRLVEPDGEPSVTKIKRIKGYLEYLRANQYHLISLDTLIDKFHSGEPIPYKTAVFTLDDGFFDHTSIAGELFASYDCPITLFVITDFIEGKLWPWDDHVKHVLLSTEKSEFDVALPSGKLFQFNIAKASRKDQSHHLQSELKRCDHAHIYTWLSTLYHAADMDYSPKPPHAYRPASWNDLQSFIHRGHSVGPHTKSHRILSQLSDEEAQFEIADSINILKRRLPSSSACFAYPTGRLGDFLPRDEKLAEQLGCKCAVSTIPFSATRKSKLMALPRYSLPENMKNFLQYISFIEHMKNSFRAND